MLGKIFGLNVLHNSGFSLALAQGGEFAFVLFQFAGTLNILPQIQEKFSTLAVATSIAVTPLIIVFYNRLIVPNS
jgi:Kef-type K+ transport system membrane component KefB